MLPPKVHWNLQHQQIEDNEQFPNIAKNSTHKKIIVIIPSKTGGQPEEVLYKISYFFNAWKVYPSNFLDFFTENIQKQQIRTSLTYKLNNPNPVPFGYVVIATPSEHDSLKAHHRDPILKTKIWIDELLQKHKAERKPCTGLDKKLTNHFPQDFLKRSYFVIIPDGNNIPTPPQNHFPIDCYSVLESCEAITYKDTYFIRESVVSELDIHFHELIHVIQWHVLEPEAFILQYYFQATSYKSHDKLPLEEMAIDLTENFKDREHRSSYYDYVVTETKKFKLDFIIPDRD